MGSIKDRNGMDLTEEEDIKKRWQEYTEEQKRSLWPRKSWWCNHQPRARHPGMWSQVGLGLRKHHYKQREWRWWNSSWVISNSQRWCCESAALNMSANLENSLMATGLEKVSFHSNPKKGNAKECSNYCTIALISQASKAMLKILQARLQQYMNCELPHVQAGCTKGRGTRDQTANTAGSSKKQERSRKISTSALLTMPKPLTVWTTTNCGKFWKRWEYQTTFPSSWETCMQVRKQQLELDMERQTGSK